MKDRKSNETDIREKENLEEGELRRKQHELKQK